MTKISTRAILLPLLCAAVSYGAPFAVTQNADALALAQTIVGSGVTIVGTPTLTGDAVQSGTFIDFTTGPYTNPLTGASGQITIPSGVILASGPVEDADGVYNGGADTGLGGPGDPDLDPISGFDTEDAVSLSFDFIPDASEIFIQYLFASTEYPGFVNSTVNDVFAFFVNGTNVALIPGSNDPVTINTVNVGELPGNTDPSNPEFFTQYSESGVTPFNYGGATVLLTARATVTPNQVNTFRFALADAGDDILDSAVLIGAGQITTTPPPGIPEPGTYLLMGAGLTGLMMLRRRLS